jgi:GGDEF domain-containing protein
VAGDLVLGLEPAWDPGSAVRAIERLCFDTGLLTAYGPETAWLTTEVDRFIERAALPFERRFRWPELATHQRDRRTQLPFLGYLLDLECLYLEIDHLRTAPVELAFLDLAGFGDWNNAFGMAAGDDVLRFLADQLALIPWSVAIRDGGDEFVVVGAPFGVGLAARLMEFRTAFPVRFHDRFGDDAIPVAPRIITTTVTGGSLVAGRDQLGRDIARAKTLFPRPDASGVQVESSDL